MGGKDQTKGMPGINRDLYPGVRGGFHGIMGGLTDPLFQTATAPYAMQTTFSGGPVRVSGSDARFVHLVAVYKAYCGHSFQKQIFQRMTESLNGGELTVAGENDRLCLLNTLYANTRDPDIQAHIRDQWFDQNMVVLNGQPYTILSNRLIQNLPVRQIPDILPLCLNRFVNQVSDVFSEVQFAEDPVRTFRSMLLEFAAVMQLNRDSSALSPEATAYVHALVTRACQLLKLNPDGFAVIEARHLELIQVSNIPYYLAFLRQMMGQAMAEVQNPNPSDMGFAVLTESHLDCLQRLCESLSPKEYGFSIDHPSSAGTVVSHRFEGMGYQPSMGFSARAETSVRIQPRYSGRADDYLGRLDSGQYSALPRERTEPRWYRGAGPRASEALFRRRYTLAAEAMREPQPMGVRELEDDAVSPEYPVARDVYGEPPRPAPQGGGWGYDQANLSTNLQRRQDTVLSESLQESFPARRVGASGRQRQEDIEMQALRQATLLRQQAQQQRQERLEREQQELKAAREAKRLVPPPRPQQSVSLPQLEIRDVPQFSVPSVRLLDITPAVTARETARIDHAHLFLRRERAAKAIQSAFRASLDHNATVSEQIATFKLREDEVDQRLSRLAGDIETYARYKQFSLEEQIKDGMKRKEIVDAREQDDLLTAWKRYQVAEGKDMAAPPIPLLVDAKKEIDAYKRIETEAKARYEAERQGLILSRAEASDPARLQALDGRERALNIAHARALSGAKRQIKSPLARLVIGLQESQQIRLSGLLGKVRLRQAATATSTATPSVRGPRDVDPGKMLQIGLGFDDPAFDPSRNFGIDPKDKARRIAQRRLAFLESVLSASTPRSPRGGGASSLPGAGSAPALGSPSPRPPSPVVLPANPTGAALTPGDTAGAHPPA